MLQICRYFIKNNKHNVKWHRKQKVPYVTRGNVWVGYDNEYSLEQKVGFHMVTSVVLRDI